MKYLQSLALCLMTLFAPALTLAGDYGSLALATVYGYGGACNNRPLVVNNFTPPYFAMHPPVYYGQRFYRPYGDSPYASWPQLQPNPAYMPRPQATIDRAVTIDNPHYAPANPMVPSYAPAPTGDQVIPEQILPQIEQPKLDQPAQPKKTPDVVKAGPITIENPYFSESTQYISKQ